VSPFTQGLAGYDQYKCSEPRKSEVTVERVLMEMTAEDLILLQRAIPSELAKRISTLEKSAREANRVLELARQAVGEVKP